MFSITSYNPFIGKVSLTFSASLLDNIKPAKRYAVILENGLDLAQLLIEIYKKNAIAVPIAPNTHQAQIDHIISHSDVDGIFSKSHKAITFTTRQSTYISPPEDRFIIYTSGSTGNPKGVVHTKTSVESNARAVAKLHQFGPESPHATCLPLFHCNALMMSLIGCYLTNTPLVVLNKFDANVYFKIIDKYQIKTASIVPALLEQLINTAPNWPQSLKYLITAAAPLSKNLANNFFKLYGPKLIQGYGLSEAVNFSFVTPLLSPEQFVAQYIWSTPPVGVPLENTEFKLTEEGEVLVKGQNNMKGYWLNEEATNVCLSKDNWLKTGDLGEVREEYLVLTGRKKEVINKGGETYYPAALEEMYRENFESNIPFIVVPSQHKILDNDISVIIDTSVQSLSQENLFRSLEHFFSSGLIPSSLSFKPVSRTSTGKPQRLKDAKHLFTYQGTNKSVLKQLWLLRNTAQLDSSSKLKVEKVLNIILSDEDKTEAINLIDEKLENQPCPKTSLLEKVIEQYIEFKSCGYHGVDLNEACQFQINENDTAYYLPLLSDLEKIFNTTTENNEVSYFYQPNSLAGKLHNPFTVDSSSENFDLIELISRIDFATHWVSLSPIKFKKHIFFYFITIGRHS